MLFVICLVNDLTLIRSVLIAKLFREPLETGRWVGIGIAVLVHRTVGDLSATVGVLLIVTYSTVFRCLIVYQVFSASLEDGLSYICRFASSVHNLCRLIADLRILLLHWNCFH